MLLFSFGTIFPVKIIIVFILWIRFGEIELGPFPAMKLFGIILTPQTKMVI